MTPDTPRIGRLREIAEAHGGTLDVQSVVEQGSVFRLELPAG